MFGYPDDIKLYNGFLSSNQNVSKLGETFNDPNNMLDVNFLSGTDRFTVEELELFEIA